MNKIKAILKKYFNVLGYAFVIVSILVYSIFFDYNIILIITGIVAVLLNIIVDILINRSNYKRQNNKYRNYLVEELERKEKEVTVIKRDSNKQTKTNDTTDINAKKQIDFFEIRRDIIALMLKNNDEITEYFRISKSQAKSSYYFSIVSCILGFIMLGAALYVIFVIGNYQYAIIGTVSGAITEVIAGTVLVIHNKSALQLNHYYDALHQNERFLSAVNLADKLNDEKREEMYIEIIRKQIEIQNNKEERPA